LGIYTRIDQNFMGRGTEMDLKIELIGNPWINAGIVGFYELHQGYWSSNPNNIKKRKMTDL
jgi:hypothetical protein